MNNNTLSKYKAFWLNQSIQSCTTTSAMTTAAPGAAAGGAAAMAIIIILPGFCPSEKTSLKIATAGAVIGGAPTAIPGAIIGCLISPVHSIFKARNRKPILGETDTINNKLTGLSELEANNTTEFESIIKNICDEYKGNFFTQSNSSGELIEVLKAAPGELLSLSNPKHSKDSKSEPEFIKTEVNNKLKCKMLQEYMTKANKQGLLYNNGKALFRIIASALPKTLMMEPTPQENTSCKH